MMTEEQLRLYNRELARSFSPRQWFAMEGDDTACLVESEDKIMWVYRLIAGAFVVGFFTPDRQWVEDQPYESRALAAERVHYLNGG